jgi:hypothetical protein
MTVTAATYDINFTGVNLPFTVADMIGSAINFIGIYGQWVILALGVIFAPVLYGLVMKLITVPMIRSAREKNGSKK